MAKFKVKVNDVENIKELLQITYDLADAQIIQAQNEINKLTYSTNLQDEIMDSKSKYAKAINDYLKIKNEAISKKIDIAKLLTEICKHNGNVDEAVNDKEATKGISFNFDSIRELIENGNKEQKTEVIELKK